VLLLELGEQAGDTVVLQLVPERAVDVARQLPGADGFASLGEKLFVQSEGDLLGAHV
jgi:hypothetical protein